MVLLRLVLIVIVMGDVCCSTLVVWLTGVLRDSHGESIYWCPVVVVVVVVDVAVIVVCCY